MKLLDMNQNSSFLYAIDHEAIQSWADTHLQNSYPGKDIAIKPLSQSLWIICAIMKPINL